MCNWPSPSLQVTNSFLLCLFWSVFKKLYQSVKASRNFYQQILKLNQRLDDIMRTLWVLDQMLVMKRSSSQWCVFVAVWFWSRLLCSWEPETDDAFEDLCCYGKLCWSFVNGNRLWLRWICDESRKIMIMMWMTFPSMSHTVTEKSDGVFTTEASG